MPSDEGIFTIHELTVTHAPLKSTTLSMKTDILPDDLPGNNLQLKLNFRDCVKGESLQNNSCVICEKGTYSLSN